MFRGRIRLILRIRMAKVAHQSDIMLKGTWAATQVLKEAFNLSDGEEKFIVNAKIGEGILVTQEGRIPFYNFLSDEERRLFTTKPKEVTA
jgi:hypothetical protein